MDSFDMHASATGVFSAFQRRAAKLNQELGGEGWRTWSEPPKKPKWMRWATYERKLAKWRRVAAYADAEYQRLCIQILRSKPKDH
jgi:hypothetical protein